MINSTNVLSHYFNMDPKAFAVTTQADSALLAEVIASTGRDISKEGKYALLTQVYYRNSELKKLGAAECIIKKSHLEKCGLIAPSQEVADKFRKRTVEELTRLFNLKPEVFQVETKYDYALLQAKQRLEGRKHIKACPELYEEPPFFTTGWDKEELEKEISKCEESVSDLVGLRNNSLLDIGHSECIFFN